MQAFTLHHLYDYILLLCVFVRLRLLLSWALRYCSACRHTGQWYSGRSTSASLMASNCWKQCDLSFTSKQIWKYFFECTLSIEPRQCTRHCRTPNSYSSFRYSSGRWSNRAVTTIVQIQTSVRELLQGYWYFQCYCASLLLYLSVLGWLRAAEPRRLRATRRQEQVSSSKLGDCLRRSDFYSQNGSGRWKPLWKSPAADQGRKGSCAVVTWHIEPPVRSWSTVYYL